MKTLRTLISLVLLACAVGGSGIFLVRLRSAAQLPGPGELLSAPPEEAVYGAVWLLAAAVTAWVALTSILSMLAYAARIPAAVRAVEWMTLPPVRRLSQRVSALMLAAAAGLTSPAAALQLPPAPFTAGPAEQTAEAAETAAERPAPPGAAAPIPLRPGGQAAEHIRTAVHRASAAAPAPLRVGGPGHHRTAAENPPAPRWTGPAAPIPLQEGRQILPAADGSRGGDGLYTVQPGDNMWSIASDCLTAREGKTPSADRIAEAWRQMIDLNRSRIISGDPDLIFPGEQLLMPPPSGTG